jgi:hypothetical protein
MTKIERAGVKQRQESPTVAPTGIVGTKPGLASSVKGVLFGPPKTGKTTLACSGNGVLLVSFDPQGESTETLLGRDDITVVRPRTPSEVEGIIKSLHSVDKGRFPWVVIDSLTFLFLQYGGKDITDTYKAGGDIRRAYGKAGAAVQQVIHDLVMMEDQNVIFTAHLEKVSTEDEQGVPLETRLGENEVKIAVTPMVWKILGPAVSFQGRTFKETVYDKDAQGKRNKRTRFAVSFNDGDRSPAGSRLPMAGEYENEPHALQKLADTLKEGAK